LSNSGSSIENWLPMNSGGRLAERSHCLRAYIVSQWFL
jgi:hypothetical protein